MISFKKIARKIYPIEAAAPSSGKFLFNYRRLWIAIFVLTTVISSVPLAIFAIIDFNFTQKAAVTESSLRLSNLVFNTAKFVSFFLEERKYAMNFLIKKESYEYLKKTANLENVLKSLNESFGGVADIGIIDSGGTQKSYAGPYKLLGKNYKDYEWFKEVVSKGHYVSDVFYGYRNTPHLVIAMKNTLPDSTFFIIRLTIQEKFLNILSRIQVGSDGDAFLINNQGILQTESRYFGHIFNKTPFTISDSSGDEGIIPGSTEGSSSKLTGWSRIPDTPFILIIVKNKIILSDTWFNSRNDFIKLLAMSISLIVLWALGMTSYIVKKLKQTDEKRIHNMKMAEYESKMASIGRLAAGVAHEINNPLSIIYEKAGLIKDLFSIQEKYAKDEKLLKTLDSIINSVERCGNITRGLLGFARQKDVSVEDLDIETVISDVINFLKKEAEYRTVRIILDIAGGLPKIESDKGKLQQILLNLIGNAFDAMKEQGKLAISAYQAESGELALEISDDGCGIPEKNIERIFEPFFTTKANGEGTGLGLAITYNLVQELGAKILVKSKPGEGTTFTILLPVKLYDKEFEHESIIS